MDARADQVQAGGAAAVLMKRTLTPAQWDAQAGPDADDGRALDAAFLPNRTRRPTIISLNADAAAALAPSPTARQSASIPRRRAAEEQHLQRRRNPPGQRPVR